MLEVDGIGEVVLTSLLEAAYRAIVPEAHGPDGVPPDVLIEAALSAQAHAERLVRAAVIASHERGLSWTQIGRNWAACVACSRWSSSGRGAGNSGRCSGR